MSWLSDHEIEDTITVNADTVTREAFHGVFPIDNLPTFISSYPLFLVVNTQCHNLPGEHWIAIFIDKTKRGEVFDSFAMPPNILLSRWMNRFSRTWTTNVRSFQNPLSATCGAYVIYFVLKRLSVRGLNDISRSLNSHPHVNDKHVVDFYNSLK